ncbi:MAG: hypothetical protein FWE24_10900 [Defluviitaleaceae bacterium]|nr:hypothetical protein [Defluviitaleaceae bacterium]
MKKYALALVMTVLFSLTACNQETTSPVSYIQVSADTEIEAAYQRAVEAFTWFNKSTMPADWENQVTDENGNVYMRVIHDNISTLADLEAHLYSIFVPDIVNELFNAFLPHQMYRDFDGALHTMGGDRGGDLTKGDEVHEIIRESDQRIIYRVSVDVLDIDTLSRVVDTEVYDFVYELIDGEWLFTNFNLTR